MGSLTRDFDAAGNSRAPKKRRITQPRGRGAVACSHKEEFARVLYTIISETESEEDSENENRQDLQENEPPELPVQVHGPESEAPAAEGDAALDFENLAISTNISPGSKENKQEDIPEEGQQDLEETESEGSDFVYEIHPAFYTAKPYECYDSDSEPSENETDNEDAPEEPQQHAEPGRPLPLTRHESDLTQILSAQVAHDNTDTSVGLEDALVPGIDSLTLVEEDTKSVDSVLKEKNTNVPTTAPTPLAPHEEQRPALAGAPAASIEPEIAAWTAGRPLDPARPCGDKENAWAANEQVVHGPGIRHSLAAEYSNYAPFMWPQATTNYLPTMHDYLRTLQPAFPMRNDVWTPWRGWGVDRPVEVRRQVTDAEYQALLEELVGLDRLNKQRATEARGSEEPGARATEPPPESRAYQNASMRAAYAEWGPGAQNLGSPYESDAPPVAPMNTYLGTIGPEPGNDDLLRQTLDGLIDIGQHIVSIAAQIRANQDVGEQAYPTPYLSPSPQPFEIDAAGTHASGTQSPRNSNKTPIWPRTTASPEPAASRTSTSYGELRDVIRTILEDSPGRESSPFQTNKEGFNPSPGIGAARIRARHESTHG